MDKKTSTSNWGYRIRIFLIVLIGLSILFKIGNLLLPSIIDINFEDIGTLILAWIVILFIYIVIAVFTAPIPSLIGIVAIILLIIGLRKQRNIEQQNIDQVQPDEQNPKQGNDAPQLESMEQISEPNMKNKLDIK